MTSAQEALLAPRRGKRSIGFESAAVILTMGLSREAATNVVDLIKSVAKECGHNDSKMIRTFRKRLSSKARRQEWAREVLAHLEWLVTEKAGAAKAATA